MQRHLSESADKILYRQLQSNHLCLGWWKTAAYNMLHLFMITKYLFLQVIKHGTAVRNRRLCIRYGNLL